MAYSEEKRNTPDPRADRYAKSIDRCATREELRELLTLIISARLPEKEFSGLYAATARRCAELKDRRDER